MDPGVLNKIHSLYKELCVGPMSNYLVCHLLGIPLNC